MTRPDFLSGGEPARLIPIASIDLEVAADLQQLMIHCSIRLASPKDKRSTKTRVNWLLRQLKKTVPPGSSVVPPGPARREVFYEVDLNGKLSGRKVFIEEQQETEQHFIRKRRSCWSPRDHRLKSQRMKKR